jgi:hypothetical protein
MIAVPFRPFHLYPAWARREPPVLRPSRRRRRRRRPVRAR